MRKSELKNGMIVKSSGDRWGVVVLKDNTDENCIKFFYSPKLLIEHGYTNEVYAGSQVESLDLFDEELIVRWTEETEKVYKEMNHGKSSDIEIDVPLWSIDEVYTLNNVYTREEESYENLG